MINIFKVQMHLEHMIYYHLSIYTIDSSSSPIVFINLNNPKPMWNSHYEH